MTRLLVLGLLLLIAIGLLVSRLQPYLRGAQEFLRAFRSTTASGPRPSGTPRMEVLVACVTCGARVPASRVLSAGDGATYCSAECRDRDAGPARHLAG